MDPELLRLLLAIFGSQGEADTGSPDSPYVPSLTDYTGDYYSAMTTPTPNDALGTQSTGGGQAEQQIGGLKPVPSLTTDRSFFTPIPFATAMMPTTDWNAQPAATGHIGPRTFEDGTSTPGEPDPVLVPQMIAGQFQQYPANGVPRPQPTYLNALQAALQQAHANGGRQPRDLFIGRSNEPYFDEYDQAFASHRDPINPSLIGLFGGPAQGGLAGLANIKGNGAGPQPAPTAEPVARFNDALPKAKQRQTKTIPKRQNAQQAVQQITRQAQAAQPQRQYSAPIPQPQRQFSAPAPTFTNAPASRSAAQNSLANTLNLMRSLVRR